jgi:hypothetical protein
MFQNASNLNKYLYFPVPVVSSVFTRIQSNV